MGAHRSAIAVELLGVGEVAKEHLLGDVRGVVATARVAGNAVHEVPVVGRCDGNRCGTVAGKNAAGRRQHLAAQRGARYTSADRGSNIPGWCQRSGSESAGSPIRSAVPNTMSSMATTARCSTTSAVQAAHSAR